MVESTAHERRCIQLGGRNQESKAFGKISDGTWQKCRSANSAEGSRRATVPRPGEEPLENWGVTADIVVGAFGGHRSWTVGVLGLEMEALSTLTHPAAGTVAASRSVQDMGWPRTLSTLVLMSQNSTGCSAQGRSALLPHSHKFLHVDGTSFVHFPFHVPYKYPSPFYLHVVPCHSAAPHFLLTQLT